MRVIQDIFPAIVSMTTTQPTPDTPLNASNPTTTLNAKTVDRTRTIITDTRIIIAVDSPAGPKVIFNQLYDQASLQKGATSKTDSYLTTAQAEPIYIAYRRAEDCSCGSRLRGWQPFGALHATNSTKD